MFLQIVKSDNLNEIVLKNLSTNPRLIVVQANFFIIFYTTLVQQQNMIPLYKTLIHCSIQTINHGKLTKQMERDVDFFLNQSLPSTSPSSLYQNYIKQLKAFTTIFYENSLITHEERDLIVKYFEVEDEFTPENIIPFQGKSSAYLWLWLHLNSPCDNDDDDDYEQRDVLFQHVLDYMDLFIYCAVCKNEYKSFLRRFIQTCVVCGDPLALALIKAHWHVNYTNKLKEQTNGIISDYDPDKILTFLREHFKTFTNGKDSFFIYNFRIKHQQYLAKNGSLISLIINGLHRDYDEIKNKFRKKPHYYDNKKYENNLARHRLDIADLLDNIHITEQLKFE